MRHKRRRRLGGNDISKAGSGLLRYGNALVPFINKFPMDTELYRLITTRPSEGVFTKGQVDFDA